MDYKGLGFFFLHLKRCYPVQFRILRYKNMRVDYIPVKNLFKYHKFPGKVMLPEDAGSWTR